jgi:hypothetical protein
MKPSINEPSDESECELDAFQKGFVFWEHSTAEYLPPIDDAGRREWLEGFLQAHADYPDTLDPEEGETGAGGPRPAAGEASRAAGAENNAGCYVCELM